MDDERQLSELTDAWCSAELRADDAFLARTLTDDFVAIGPLGFMLTKEDWLQRHRSGDLKYQALSVDELKVRLYAEAAVVTGHETQQATYRAQPTPGQFRTMMVWVRQQGQWRLAGLQLSPITQVPPGMPPR